MCVFFENIDNCFSNRSHQGAVFCLINTDSTLILLFYLNVNQLLTAYWSCFKYYLHIFFNTQPHNNFVFATMCRTVKRRQTKLRGACFSAQLLVLPFTQEVAALIRTRT